MHRKTLIYEKIINIFFCTKKYNNSYKSGLVIGHIKQDIYNKSLIWKQANQDVQKNHLKQKMLNQ